VAVTKHATGRGNFTYEDLRHTPDDGQRYEVLEGDLIVSPSPKVKHQEIVLRVIRLLDQADRAECGRLLLAPMDVALSPRDVVEPDLLFIAKDRLGIVTEDNVQGAPDLVVEVISEGSRKRDAITKRDLYARYGVRFYWLVDPEEETVRVFELQDGAYGEPTTLRAGQQLTCPLFPGITAGVGRLFAAP
jgi:Uma2 family endonuclease